MTRGRWLLWGAVLATAAAGLVGNEVAKRTSLHIPPSHASRIVWPDQLALERSDLAQYLRYQFNVDAAPAEPGSKSRLSIHAGLCQLAGRGRVEPADMLAAEATLVIAQRPWFGEFVEAERALLVQLHDEEGWSLDRIRARFIEDLAAFEAFDAAFAEGLEQAAAARDLRLLWSGESPATE